MLQNNLEESVMDSPALIKLNLSNRLYHASVSAEDYDKVKHFLWYEVINKQKRYVEGFIEDGSQVYLHRYLMHPSPGFVVDHIDGNGLNNTRENLRIVTFSQNNLNRPKRGGTSKYNGVNKPPHLTGKKKFCAGITVNKRRKHLGVFQHEEDAAKAYDKAARAVYGSLANLNFPDDNI